MENMNTKKKLYVLSTLFLCINMQGTEATKTDLEVSPDSDNVIKQQALDAYDLTVTRIHNRPNRPNSAAQNAAGLYNSGSYNMTGSQQNMSRPQNVPVSQNMPVSQYIPGSQNSMTNMTGTQNSTGSSYTMGSQNMTGAQPTMSHSQNMPGSQNSMAHMTGTQNSTGSSYTMGSQNMAGAQPTMLHSQNMAGAQNSMANMTSPQNSTGSYTMGSQNMTGAQQTMPHSQNMAGVQNSMAHMMGTQNSTGSYTMGSQNMAGAQPTMPHSQNMAGAQNSMAHMMGTQNSTGSSYTMGSQNNTESYPMNSLHHNSGRPDTSFGGGYVTNALNTKSTVRAIATQKNNKIVVGGTTNQNVVAGGVTNQNAVLVRYNDDGNPDATFGARGVMNQKLGDTTNSSFNAITVQKFDQKVVGAGQSDGKITLARYYENGAPDTLFGKNGIVQTDIDGEVNAIAVQENNYKIVVAGHSHNTDSNNQIMLMRYNENGILDDTFGTQGATFLSVKGSSSHANGIAIQEDGKIVVVGTYNPYNAENRTDIFIARYNNNGTLDKSFGTDHSGIVTINMVTNHQQVSTHNTENNVANDVVIKRDGTIVVVGSTETNGKHEITVVYLTRNGVLNNAYPSNGVQHIHYATSTGNYDIQARSVALDAHENIILMGYLTEDTNEHFLLVRLHENGEIDKSWGNNGFSHINMERNMTDVPTVGAMQYDKKKLVLATNYSPTQFAVTRVLN